MPPFGNILGDLIGVARSASPGPQQDESVSDAWSRSRGHRSQDESLGQDEDD